MFKKNSDKDKLEKSNKNKLKSEIISIVLVCISILLIISIFSSSSSENFSENAAGYIGGFVAMIMRGSFGIGAYVIPFIIIELSIESFFSNDKKIKLSKFIMIIFLFIILISFMHTINRQDNVSPFWYFNNGSALNGGFIGAIIGDMLYNLIGFGTYIIFATSAIILIVLITRKSFLQFSKKCVKKAYDQIKNTNNSNTEKHKSDNDGSSK